MTLEPKLTSFKKLVTIIGWLGTGGFTVSIGALLFRLTVYFLNAGVSILEFTVRRLF